MVVSGCDGVVVCGCGGVVVCGCGCLKILRGVSDWFELLNTLQHPITNTQYTKHTQNNTKT